jgi:redox-sensitive bicupin YhaK (pirin superfamily)
LSFILKGSLEHKDTMGNHSVIEPGEIQLMSAGSGVQHSEFNPSEASDTELFQIWIQPNKENTKPRYQQFTYAKRVVRNKPLLIASSEANENTVLLYQDVAIFSCMFAKDFNFDVVNRGSSYWIQMISGEVAIGELHLLGRDGAGFEKEELQSITARQDSEFLLFEFKE